MSIEMPGITSVLARIAQIQASFPGNPVARTVTAAPASAATAPGALVASETAATDHTAAPDFATALAGLQAPHQPTGADVVGSAEKYLGVPYVFGGTSPSGLDCSGLVQKAYGDLGVSLPRIAADQATVGTPVAGLAQARPGDILGFGQPAHHVAIYLGNDLMIAAPEPGEKVKIQSVYETPASIRRVVGSADPAGAGSVPAGFGALGFGSAGLGPAGLGSVGLGSVGLGSVGLSSVGLGSAGLAPLDGGVPAAGVGKYAGVFAQNEARYQLPRGLLAAVAQTESGGNPAAVSPAGAQGLMQLMPGTAQRLGVNPWVPDQAVQGAAQLLSNYLHTFGSVPLALAAYNAGPGAVEQYGGVPPYTETQNYVTKITGLMAGRAA